MRDKLAYLASQAFNQFLARPSCPNCGSGMSTCIDRKYVISQLRKCDQCLVSFRWPVDREDTAKTFYQDQYRQKGLTTDLPADEELRRLIDGRFRGSEKDFTNYIYLLNALTCDLGWDAEAITILDYGANWGYFLWQLVANGFPRAVGLEVSDRRRSFGESRLGVKYINSRELLPKSLDVIVSLHVIEHLPRPRLLLDEACRALRPGGLLIIECPNGSL